MIDDPLSYLKFDIAQGQVGVPPPTSKVGHKKPSIMCSYQRIHVEYIVDHYIFSTSSPTICIQFSDMDLNSKCQVIKNNNIQDSDQIKINKHIDQIHNQSFKNSSVAPL